MYDLHTHLLPNWDDGAPDCETAFRLITRACEDGIEKICLTPHLFRQTKHGDDPEEMKKRMAAFLERTRSLPVSIYGGAEIHIHPRMGRTIKEHGLTVNGSRYAFIEFPAEHVPAGARDLLFEMTLRGLVPIISHPERNAVFANRPGVLYELISMGALGQVTAQSLTGDFGRRTRDAAEELMKLNLVHLIASDAHDEARPPELSKAVKKAAKIVGEEKARAMVTDVPAAIIEDRDVPYLGEPVDPGHKKSLHF
jgi:protein-tyrosine phosphatase